MIAVIPYRAVDGFGVWGNGPVAIGHAKLQTTPEASAETSPFVDETSGLVLSSAARAQLGQRCRYRQTSCGAPAGTSLSETRMFDCGSGRGACEAADAVAVDHSLQPSSDRRTYAPDGPAEGGWSSGGHLQGSGACRDGIRIDRTSPVQRSGYSRASD